MRISLFSSPFTVASLGNLHLRQEYLAVLETNHHTPYFLNLHYRDVAHTMILGRTGAGKSFLLNFLITNLQKYDPHTFIFDLGGSFESLTHLFGGSYVRVGLESGDFKINPFSLPPTKENLDFLALFVKVLIQGSRRRASLIRVTERDLFRQSRICTRWIPRCDTLGVLANTLGHENSRAASPGRLRRPVRISLRQLRGHHFVLPISVLRLSAISQYPELLEPLFSTSCIGPSGYSGPSIRCAFQSVLH